MSGVAKKLMSSAGGGEPEGAWDLSYAYYDPPAAWDVSTGKHFAEFLVSGKTTFPTDIFFKPDGTKMYIMDVIDRFVLEYHLSNAWVVSTASYVRNFYVGGQEAVPTGLFFKPDGTKMYVAGKNGDEVNEYDLSIAWDVSSASFLQFFKVLTQDGDTEGLFFKPDGLKMYIVGSNNDSVFEYDLSTAWNITTASFLQSFSVVAQTTAPEGIFIKPDGTKMYIISSNNDSVFEYDLSTAWDISSAIYNQALADQIGETGQEGFFFKPDGTVLYIIGETRDAVQTYTLGGFSVAAQETVPQDLFFKPDGTKMYVLGSTGDDVNEYDLSTNWDVSTATFLQNFSVAAQETAPFGLSFKPDGTKMYVIGGDGDDVNEYDLSTAWDVSTASFLQLFSIAAQDLVPRGVFFKPDGTKMYFVGSAGDSVYEYDLSTAWNVSTASFLQSFSVAAQETSPLGLFFKPDGTKMYVVGSNVNEYDLSTAWDVSTASFLQLFSIAAQDAGPTGVFFKPDGTKMYVTGSVSDAVYSYTLGVQE